MKTAVIGSRGPKMPPDDFIGPLSKLQAEHMERLTSVRRYVSNLPEGTIVVTRESSVETSVDYVAKEAAKSRTPHLPVSVFYMRPDMYGSGAGYARNLSLISDVDQVTVWWDGQPGLTEHLIASAQGRVAGMVVFP